MNVSEPYLRSSPIVDFHHPLVRGEASRLAAGATDAVDIARRCFLFVRDEVLHSSDHERGPVTLKASEALEHRTGFCFSKSVLLTALLRANGIPAGLCYQRLRAEDPGRFILHGLTAARLPGFGWYRMDPRGNNASVSAEFHPPEERLAFTPERPGEADLPEIWPDPLPLAVEALSSSRTWREVLDNLPDVELAGPR